MRSEDDLPACGIDTVELRTADPGERTGNAPPSPPSPAYSRRPLQNKDRRSQSRGASSARSAILVSRHRAPHPRRVADFRIDMPSELPVTQRELDTIEALFGEFLKTLFRM